MSFYLPELCTKICNHTYVKNISYRPLARSDGFPLFQAATHPEFNQFLVWNTPTHVDEAILQIDKLLREVEMRKAVAISICEKDLGTWWGVSVLRPFRGGIEISLYLHPLVWSKGISLTAGRGIIASIFDAYPDTTVFGRAIEGNTRIIRIYEHYKFEPTNHDRAVHVTRGELQVPVYQLTIDRWKTVSELKHY